MPSVGEKTHGDLYRSVGAALSEWEHLEGILSLLFGAFLGLETTSMPAQRAYGSIAAFNGRRDLLIGSASGYFQMHPDAEQEANLKAMLREIKLASGRRNEIAHGTVVVFPRWAGPDEHIGYLLTTNFYSTVKNGPNWEPKYAYDCAIIDRFAHQFSVLTGPPAGLLTWIIGKHQAQRAGRIPPSEPKPGTR